VPPGFFGSFAITTRTNPTPRIRITLPLVRTLFNIQFDIRPLQPEQLTWSLPHRGRQRHQVRQISFLAILRHGWRGVGLDRRRTFPFLLCQLARTRQHRPANRSQDELEVVDLNVSSTARGSGGHGGRSAVLARLICGDGLSSGHAELALISLQGRIFPVPRWLLFVDVARRAEVKAGAARPHPEGAWP